MPFINITHLTCTQTQNELRLLHSFTFGSVAKYKYCKHDIQTIIYFCEFNQRTSKRVNNTNCQYHSDKLHQINGDFRRKEFGSSSSKCFMLVIISNGSSYRKQQIMNFLLNRIKQQYNVALKMAKYSNKPIAELKNQFLYRYWYIRNIFCILGVNKIGRVKGYTHKRE